MREFNEKTYLLTEANPSEDLSKYSCSHPVLFILSGLTGFAAGLTEVTRLGFLLAYLFDYNKFKQNKDITQLNLSNKIMLGYLGGTFVVFLPLASSIYSNSKAFFQYYEGVKYNLQKKKKKQKSRLLFIKFLRLHCISLVYVMIYTSIELIMNKRTLEAMETSLSSKKTLAKAIHYSVAILSGMLSLVLEDIIVKYKPVRLNKGGFSHFKRYLTQAVLQLLPLIVGVGIEWGVNQFPALDAPFKKPENFWTPLWGIMPSAAISILTKRSVDSIFGNGCNFFSTSRQDDESSDSDEVSLNEYSLN